MYNDLFSIGPITIHGYGLMIGIGILCAYLLAEHLVKKKGLKDDEIFNILIVVLLFGWASSKLLYFFTIRKEILQDPSLLWKNLGNGWVVYGGIIGGVLSAVVYLKIKKLPVFQYVELCMPSVALAQGLGRMGCFLAGCCYGVETDLPIGITFSHSDFAPNNVSLMPTQLMSSGYDLLLFLILLILVQKNARRGMVLGTYTLVYSIGRFFIEFYRGDLARGTIGSLSTSQFISIFTILAGALILILGFLGKLGGTEAAEESVSNTDRTGATESNEVKSGTESKEDTGS